MYLVWYGNTEELPDHEDDNEVFVRPPSLEAAITPAPPLIHAR